MKERLTAESLQNYWDEKGVEYIKRRYRYDRRGADEVLKRLRAPTGLIVEGYLLRVFRDQGFDVECERDNKSVYDPKSLFDALERYQPREIKYDPKIMSNAISMAFKAFGFKEGLKRLQPLVHDAELYSAIRLDTSSGAPHFGKKRDTFRSDFRRAGRILNSECAPPPCVSYHRVQHGKEGPKTRLVWGYPLSMTIAEARYARPLIDRFLGMRTPISFGLMNYQIGARVMEIQNRGVTYCLDFSKFDASVPNRLVHAAFDILKSHFSEQGLNQAHWDKIVSYFLNTPILMPDGNVYQKSCGIPSGSYFTQLVGSIVNYILIQYLCMVTGHGPVPERFVNVLGDDSIFSLPDWESIQELSKIAESLGMSISTSKSGRFRTDESPVFLGYSWTAGIPERPVIDVVKRMIFPEKPSRTGKSTDEHVTRTLSRVVSLGGLTRDAWKTVAKTGLLGRHNDMSAYFTFFRRQAYPLTGAEEVRSLHTDGGPLLTTDRSLVTSIFK